MKTEEFRRILDDGHRVARWFMLNFALLLDMILYNIHDIQEWRVEGADYIFDTLQWVKKDIDLGLESVCAEFGMSLSSECLKPIIVHGGIEIKGVAPGKLLERNDLGPCAEPVVPFALWDGNAQDKKSKATRYTRAAHGSLRRFFEPECISPSNNNGKRLSAEPKILAYVLECCDENGHPRPYATIVFTDFVALKQRLIQYAGENGLDITDWDSIPVGEAAKNFKCGNLILPPNTNLWYVPMSVLAGLAHIIIIGDSPNFFQNGSCTVEMQKRRYQSLCDHAAAFIPYEQFRLDGEIEDNLPDHAVFHLLASSKVKKGELRDADGHIMNI